MTDQSKPTGSRRVCKTYQPPPNRRMTGALPYNLANVCGSVIGDLPGLFAWQKRNAARSAKAQGSRFQKKRIRGQI